MMDKKMMAKKKMMMKQKEMETKHKSMHGSVSKYAAKKSKKGKK